MGQSAVEKLLMGFARRDRAVASRGQSAAGSRLRWPRSFAFGAAMFMLAPGASLGGVLSESDFQKVETIKPLFQNLMGDLVQTAKRPDVSNADVQCVMQTIRELLQISEELSSYEYLITIEKEVTDFGDNSPVKGVVKFAIEKANTILAEEKKRLVALPTSKECEGSTRLAVGKTQQALQFIDTTINLLNSIQVRL
jgi:hypothetical protein